MAADTSSRAVMAPAQSLHLPDGQTFTVTRVFGGVAFRNLELEAHHAHSFHLGWTAVLHTQRDDAFGEYGGDEAHDAVCNAASRDACKVDNCCSHETEDDCPSKTHDVTSTKTDNATSDEPPSNTDDVSNRADDACINEDDNNDDNDDDLDSSTDTDDDLDSSTDTDDSQPWERPTRCRDSLFISFVSSPSDADFFPAASPSRQAAMMLWVTLYWYFHQAEPAPWSGPAALAAEAAQTPRAARPVDDWRVAILPRGLFASRNLLSKLEHMGLVDVDPVSGGVLGPESHTTMSSVATHSASSMATHTAASSLTTHTASPLDTRAASPTDSRTAYPLAVHVSRRSFWQLPGRLFLYTLQPTDALLTTHASEPASHGPFFSTSHLPTYFPPRPLRYIISPTTLLRHPLRAKPPRMGHVFYTRFLPSVGHYLSLRVASASPHPVPHHGPLGPAASSLRTKHARLVSLSDTQLLRAWHAVPRVARFWGPFDPAALDRNLRLAHSFPAIAMWDGVPFGYFEIYWAKEDALGRVAGADVLDWDRGIHVMIGEEWARGRVPAWLTSLVHWCFTDDLRTMNVVLEPRIDNARMLRHLEALGFSKEKQVSFPHKQSSFVRLRREAWDGPAL